MNISIYVHIHVHTKCLAITKCSDKWQVALGRKQLPLSQAWEDCMPGPCQALLTWHQFCWGYLNWFIEGSLGVD